VRKVLVKNDVAVGVELANGETVAADWVISAADGHSTIYDWLGGTYTDGQVDKTYRTLQPFPSYLQVSLGVAQLLATQGPFVTRLLDTPLSVDPNTELSRLSFRFFHYDPTFAPHGKTAVTCFLPTRNYYYWVDLKRQDPAKYELEKRRIADAAIAVLERSVPEVRKSIEVIDISTPATVIACTGNWKGSMEGWLMTPGTGFKPLRNTLPGLQRFMMVGQWVMPGGGLPSGLLTARGAIRTVCRQDHIPFTVDEPAVQQRVAA
jgi:phytoene dehydrogenase-like protein